MTAVENQAFLDIEHTPVFTWNEEAYLDEAIKIITNIGGTRSSKTYSILQLFVVIALSEENWRIEIMRKTMPAIKGTVLADFKEIITDLDLWDEIKYNQNEQKFTFLATGTEVQFISLDKPQKKRGAKRNLLYLNEANEFTIEDWVQLIMRTEGKIFMDFNPSDEHHWIYDKVLTRKDCRMIHSTYKDNPFLDQDLIDEIENLINLDASGTYYKIYALGIKAASGEIIYPNWDTYDELPGQPDQVVYGLDFGWTHPMALVEVAFFENHIYCEEMVYKRQMSTAQLVEEMIDMGIPKDAIIWADAARPDLIEEVYRAGYRNIKAADKSVKSGIEKVNSCFVHFHSGSKNLQKEVKTYKFVLDKNGDPTEVPIKFLDDLMDALRYAVHNTVRSAIRKIKRGKYKLK